MKTPEQITGQILTELDLGGDLLEGTPKTAHDLTAALQSGWIDGDTVLSMIESAIKTDRAQHKELRRLRAEAREVIGQIEESREAEMFGDVIDARDAADALLHRFVATTKGL